MSEPVTVPVITINSTADQTRTALRWMVKLIDQDKANPNFVALVRAIVASAHTETPAQEAEAVRSWIRQHITYRSDPDGTQYLQDPKTTIAVASGNCYCMAVLAGTLLMALGHSCHPLGVCWTGDIAASHAVLFDATAERVVDPVAEESCEDWPPEGYTLDHFQTAW